MSYFYDFIQVPREKSCHQTPNQTSVKLYIHELFRTYTYTHALDEENSSTLALAPTQQQCKDTCELYRVSFHSTSTHHSKAIKADKEEEHDIIVVRFCLELICKLNET